MKDLLKRIIKGKQRLAAADGAFDSVERDGLQASIHREWPADAAFPAEWEKLVDRTALACAFQSEPWCRALQTAFLKPGRLRLVTVRKGADLIAVLPLQFADGGFLENSAPALCDCLDPVVDPALEAAAWPAILAVLGKNWDWGVSGLVLHNITDGCPARQSAPAAAKAVSWTCSEEPEDKTVHIPLPTTFDAYCEMLDGHNRREMLRKLRRGEEKGAARLVTCPGDETAAGNLKLAMDLAQASGGERGASIEKYVRPVLDACGVQLMKAGRLNVRMLYIEEKPAACLLAFPSKKGPLIYNGGFDPAMNWYSPGTVITLMNVRQAIADKAPSYDMLRGQEPYKYRFAATDQNLCRLILRPA